MRLSRVAIVPWQVYVFQLLVAMFALSRLHNHDAN